MKKFYHYKYSHTGSAFVQMQEYFFKPYLFMIAIFGAVMLYLLAEKRSLVYPGVAGLLLVVLFGQLLGTLNAKRKYLEVGFDGQYFYMRSAYDLAYNKNLKFYPLSYANAVRQGENIFVNYIEHTVRLNKQEWENWSELWMAFNEQPGTGNVSVS